MDKLKNIKQPIRRWDKEEFGHMKHMIGMIEVEIKRLDNIGESNELDEVDLARKKVLNVQLKGVTRIQNFFMQ